MTAIPATINDAQAIDNLWQSVRPSILTYWPDAVGVGGTEWSRDLVGKAFVYVVYDSVGLLGFLTARPAIILDLNISSAEKIDLWVQVPITTLQTTRNLSSAAATTLFRTVTRDLLQTEYIYAKSRIGDQGWSYGEMPPGSPAQLLNFMSSLPYVIVDVPSDMTFDQNTGVRTFTPRTGWTRWRAKIVDCMNGIVRIAP